MSPQPPTYPPKPFLRKLSTTYAVTVTLPRADVEVLHAYAKSNGYDLEAFLTDLIGQHAERIRLAPA